MLVEHGMRSSTCTQPDSGYDKQNTPPTLVVVKTFFRL
jgi:hypothetical protein